MNAIIQPARQENENRAMCDMIDRYPGHSKTLFIADRGYENYNIFAHVQENGMFYLIRAKDITSNGIVSSLKNHLPDDRESFDTSVSITLTKKQIKEVKANKETYRIIMKDTPFDFAGVCSSRSDREKLLLMRNTTSGGASFRMERKNRQM